MRKTVKISTEEHLRLTRTIAAVEKELIKLQDEKAVDSKLIDAYAATITDQAEAISDLTAVSSANGEAYAEAMGRLSRIQQVWRSEDAFMLKVLLRSRWVTLYNTLKKELG